jgi:Family of unknown function (DUF5519)
MLTDRRPIVGAIDAAIATWKNSRRVGRSSDQPRPGSFGLNDAVSLPERRGLRPRTTPTNPHTQLDQQPGAAVVASLADALFALPGVFERPSAISVPGARSLWLAPEQARGPREAFMVDAEFAHLHPPPDSSLHAALPPPVAAEAIARGWAEVHPVARMGLIPENVVMIYAPRDDSEVGVVLDLVRSALAFARGEQEDGGTERRRRS